MPETLTEQEKTVERTRDGFEVLRTKTGKIRGYRLKIDVARPGLKRHQQTFTRKTTDELKAVRAKIQADRDADALVARDRMLTVAQWCTAWLAGRRKAGQIKESTLRNYEDALKPVTGMFGDLRLQHLTEADVEDLRDRMRSGELRRRGTPGKPLSARACNLTLKTLTTVLDAAVTRKKVHVNVAATVERIASDAKEREPWADPDAETFLRFIAGHRLYGCWLMSMLGLRRGEIISLRWDRDINFQPTQDAPHGTISVTLNSPLVAGVGVVEGTPKSRAGKRTLPLPKLFSDALLTMKERQESEAAEIGTMYAHSGYAAVNEFGEQLHPQWYSDEFERLVKRAEVPVRTLHECRNTCASVLISNGCSLELVSQWLGQSQLKIAERYAKVSLKALSGAGDVLDAQLAAILGGASVSRVNQITRLKAIVGAFAPDVVHEVILALVPEWVRPTVAHALTAAIPTPRDPADLEFLAA